MDTLNWEKFERKIYIKTKIDKLYDMWSTKAGITKWFLKDAEYIRNGIVLADHEKIKAGDNYIWHWHNWDGKEEGSIKSANGKDFIQMTFANSNLDIRFIEKNDFVIVDLKQYDIPTDEESKMKVHCGCNGGWTFWLTNLKAYLEHGILLNETENDLTQHEMQEFVFVNM